MGRRRTSLGAAVNSKTELKERVKACGGHFFDRDTMRFFNSKLHSVHPNARENSTYFVTSEQFVPSSGPARPRRYSVGKFVDCRTEHVGEFQQYANVRDARAAARKLAGR